MKNQVLSIPQMQELIELGVDTSKASMYWLKDIEPDMGWELFIHKPAKGFTYIPTFTLQDILEMLPESIIDKRGCTRIQMIIPQENKETIISYDKLKQFSGGWLNAAFCMLKWCKQNNHI